MADPLEEKFVTQSDMHSIQPIKVIRAKGGATRQKTVDIMDTLDQVNLHLQKRPFIIKRAVTVYMQCFP